MTTSWLQPPHRRSPKQTIGQEIHDTHLHTIIAPLVTYGFTFAAGTGHIVYPLLPVIYEVAHENGIRSERPMAIAVTASQQAITASPVSAATAAMIGLLATHHIGLVQILIICVPSTLIAVFIASLVQLRIGKELKDDPEYQKRLASGEVESLGAAGREASAPLKAGAMTSALIFLAGVALVVLAGIFPELRTVPGPEKQLILSMRSLRWTATSLSRTTAPSSPRLFDRSGTTRIGKYVINHSFLVPGLVSTTLAVAVGLLIGSMIGIETPH
jgi:anaerobic C4-dicarboxylate transporter